MCVQQEGTISLLGVLIDNKLSFNPDVMYLMKKTDRDTSSKRD